MKRTLALFAAAIFVSAAHVAFAGPVYDELGKPGNHELDVVATVTKGAYRYELTEFSCARAARLQAKGTKSERNNAYARWLYKHVAANSNSKSLTIIANGTYEGDGCYERTEQGIRVYVQGKTQPIDVGAPIMPCDPAVVQSGVCAPQAPAAPPQPMPERSPHPSLSEKLVNTLAMQPDAVYAERFLFEGRPAVLWPTTCKLSAQMQESDMNGPRDFPFIRWQLAQSGKLLTVQRIDGTYSEACYVRTARGIRIWSFELKEPLDSNWQ